MGRILFFFPLVLLAGIIAAQDYVGTAPTNKKAIIELFTGVDCINCPEGHDMIAGILANHPAGAYCVAYHPSNSSYTIPYPGDPDLRRHYPDAYYTDAYCGCSRFMPGAFINRRAWDNGVRLQSRESWSGLTESIITEASPINIGMASAYDCISGQLLVTVEIYFTSDYEGTLHIYVMLDENNIQTQQAGASGTYTHMHTFREALCPQWGDTLTGPNTKGTLRTLHFTHILVGQEYVPGNCELVAFAQDQGSGEIISGAGIDFGSATYINPGADFIADKQEIISGSQVVFRDISSGAPTLWQWTFEGGEPNESQLQMPPPVTYGEAGTYAVSLVVTNPAGSDTMLKSGFITVTSMGDEELYEKNVFSVYPNPCDGLLHIDASSLEGIEQVNLRDMNGKVIKTRNSPGHVTNFETSSLEPGLYLVEVIAGGQQYLHKLLIR